MSANAVGMLSPVVAKQLHNVLRDAIRIDPETAVASSRDIWDSLKWLHDNCGHDPSQPRGAHAMCPYCGAARP